MISIKGLNKFFNKGKQNEIHVINDITLDLPERGMIAIFGKSGCGKTTLLNVIGGLDGFASGSLTIEGQSIEKNTDEIRNKYVGYIFQNYNLSVNETCYDNVAAALRLCGMSDESEIERRVNIALKNVGMEKYARRTPDTLSGGQQQRIAIARAIVKNPPVILADEPTGNLDETNTVMIMDLLREIAKDHLVILVTHEQSLVDSYCDRIIELSDGRIVSSREGRAEGVIQRGKQDIYLGELDRRDIQNEHISLEYYGERPESPVGIKIVNKDGRLYLSLADERIQIIDGTGEVRLIEGVYHETENKRHADLDMIALPSVEGSRFGRLFTLKSSLISAYGQQKKANKRGKRALRAVMLLFAIVTVFMASLFGSSIGKILDAENSYNHNTFYIYTENGDTDILAAALNDSESGIDYYSLYPYYPSGDHRLNFTLASFETFSQNAYNSGFESHGVILDENLADGHTLLAGKRELKSNEYILISNKIADDLIENSALGFVDEYSDLIGMTCNLISIGGKFLRVAGVVDSNEHAIYLTEIATAIYAFQHSTSVRVALASDFGYELKPGETIVALTDTGLLKDAPSVGKTTVVEGQELRVVDSVVNYKGYVEWINANGGKLSRGEYFASVLPEGEDLENYTIEHYFEYDAYYYDRIDEFIREYYLFDAYNMQLWLYVTKGVSEVRDLYISTDLLGAENYRSLYGRYPTKAEYDSMDESLFEVDFTEINRYHNLYESEFNSIHHSSIYNHTCLVSDADYVKISRSVGNTDQIFDNGNDYFVYTMVHSSDPDLTERFLNEKFGNRDIEYYDSVITPDGIMATVISYEEEGVIGSLIALAVTLAVMSLCMYFIMRSSIMSRIREIGIFRAIGVSKSNLVLRFGAEASLLALTTVVVGYALSSGFIGLLEYVSPNASQLFYYPLWYSLIVLIILCGLTVICGIIPVLNLLRKTPSEILAKYDV